MKTALDIPIVNASLDVEGFSWRLALIEKTGIANPLDYRTPPETKEPDNPTKPDTQKLLATAQALPIDEYDRAVLAFYTYLTKVEARKLPLPILGIFDQKLRDQINLGPKRSIDEHEALKESRIPELMALKEEIRRDELPRIRAKLAVHELTALILGEAYFPNLIAITPRYLASEVIQTWLARKQMHLHASRAEISDAARAQLKLLSEAITVPTLHKKRRHLAYWQIDAAYYDLINQIGRFRKDGFFQVKETAEYGFFKKQYGVTKEKEGLIFAKCPTPSELALDLMEAAGIIFWSGPATRLPSQVLWNLRSGRTLPETR